MAGKRRIAKSAKARGSRKIKGCMRIKAGLLKEQTTGKTASGQGS